MAIAAAFLLAFAFQGTRGLWEPDEGFYGNVAYGMATTGDWWIPRLNGLPFLDKPPLHYWGIAAGIKVFGPTELGLRAANALWFAATSWLVGLLGAGLLGRRAGPLAVLAYAVMLAPFLAANVLTPDTVLTFWVTAMAYGYWRSHTSATRGEQVGWTLAAAVFAGFGLLAKGPALMVFALPFVLHGLITEGLAVLRRFEVYVAAVLSFAIAASWYAAVVHLLPGAASYIFDNQVAGRLWSGRYHRNAGIMGPIKIYLPTLIAGCLPWSVLWPGQMRRLLNRAKTGGWRSVAELRRHPGGLLLVLWLTVPLVVLSVARSRLPFYILPAMPVLALTATARLRHFVYGAETSGKQARILWLTGWVVLLIGLKVTAAYWPSDKNTRRLAEALAGLEVGTETPIHSVDLKANALPIYGYKKLTEVRRWNPPYPFYSPHESLDAVIDRIASRDGRWIFLVREPKASDLLLELNEKLGACERLGSETGTVIIGCQWASSPR